MSATKGLVSVIIPVFNRAKLLPLSVGSVLEQTYEQWEIVLVDDGSTDDSWNVAAVMAKEHPGRIRVVKQENAGPGSARNHGISVAKGELLAILDSDDRWKASFLERMVAAFAVCPELDWVYCNVERRWEDGTPITESIFDDADAGPLRNLTVRRVEHVNVVEDERFLLTALTGTIKEGANSIIRRRVFEQVRYRPELRIGEDRVLNACGIAAGFRFGYVNEVLLTKYHHGDNISMADAGSREKRLWITEQMIKSSECVRQTLSLGRREKAALRRMLGGLNLERARLMFHSGRGLPQVLGAVARAFVVCPLNAELYRSAYLVVFKRAPHVG